MTIISTEKEESCELTSKTSKRKKNEWTRMTRHEYDNTARDKKTERNIIRQTDSQT